MNQKLYPRTRGWIQEPAVTVKRPGHFAEGDRGTTERNDVTEISFYNNGNGSGLPELTENGSEYTTYPNPFSRKSAQLKKSTR